MAQKIFVDRNYLTTELAKKANTSHASSSTTYGASSASNYGHAKASSTTPKANGAAAVGSETSSFARGDHVHPAQTTITGNAGSATKVNNNLTIKLNGGSTEGTNLFTFNGSAAKTVNVTPNSIGAAASSHTHNYAGSGSAGGTANSAARLDLARLAGSSNSANYVPGANRLVVREYGNDCTNMPSAHWYHIYTGQGSDANYNTQLAIGMTTEALYFRNKNAGTWGSWKKVSADGHTHSYLPLSGGSLTGQVYMSQSSGDTYYYARRSDSGTGVKFGVGSGGVNHGVYSEVLDKWMVYADASNVYLNGNATTATKAAQLTTARTINGTSFNGTANITTANWGTARKINQISVNGSADVKLPLDHYHCSVGDNNTNLYHHILASGQCTGDYTDKTILIVLNCQYNGGGFGIAKCSLRTNQASGGSTATGEIKWLVRSGFSENQLCFNIRNTAKDTYMDVFYKSGGAYASLTWYVLTEGYRGAYNAATWSKNNTNASGTNAYTEAAMKALRSYTSTLVSATDAGHVNSSDTANTCSGNAATATKVNNNLVVKLNGGSTEGTNLFTFNGSAAKTVNITPSAIGAAASSHTHSYAASSHTHNYAGSGSAGGAANSANILNINNTETKNTGRLQYFQKNNDSTIMPDTGWWSLIRTQHAGYDNGYWQEMAYAFASDTVKFRRNVNGTKSAWKTVAWTDSNITGSSGSCTGNAATATKLATARNITIGNKTNSFNGTGNISYTLADIGAAASSHTHNYLTVKGQNTISSTSNDTTANWGAQQTSVHWYTTTGQLNNQPSQWGYILNVGQGSEVHQIWMTQASGDMYHRGGNGSGWSGSWRKILDTSNSTQTVKMTQSAYNSATKNANTLYVIVG